MMKRLRSVLANLVLVLLSIALLFGALELVLRIVRRADPGGKEQQTRFQYIEADPLLGWRKTPGARASFERREYRTDVMINSQGLRDREREYDAAPGVFRVLALGDSFVEAFMVRLEESVTQQLERALTATGCPAEVINGGTAGYGTDQELLFYETEGIKYAPRVVLLFFYYNDVFFNQAGVNAKIAKPRLEFDGDQWKVANLPLPRFNVVEPAPARAAPEVPRGSAALAWIADRVESTAPHVYNRLARLGFWQPIRRVTPSAELAVFRKRPGPEVEKAWDQTHRILRALAKSVNERGARLMVVYIPSRMEIHDTSWEITKLRYGWGQRAWDRGEVLRRLTEIVSLERIPFLDLTPVLRKADGPFRPAFYAYDRHWNARGQRFAALEIRGHLRRLAWVPSCTD